jgi:hypothetical protein
VSFDGGGGFGASSGPAWSANTDWQINASDYVTRATGTGISLATVDWVSRESIVGVTTSSFGDGTNVGVFVGWDPATKVGVGVRLARSGSPARFRAEIVRITANESNVLSYESCSDSTVTGANLTNGTRIIRLVYDPSDPGAGATATVQKTNGQAGTVSLTSTCSLAGASGTKAGLISFSADNTRFDNFIANIDSTA